MLLQNILSLMKYKEFEQSQINSENTETLSPKENSLDFKSQEETPQQNGFFSFLENKLIYLNGVFLFFFHPLMNIKDNASVNLLEKTPFFKKAQLLLLLGLFSYLVYYFFSFLINVKNDYCSSCIWIWVIMFLFIYLIQ